MGRSAWRGWTPAEKAALDEYVRRVVDAAPPLTPEQRDKLALLLRGNDDAAATSPSPLVAGGDVLAELLDGE